RFFLTALHPKIGLNFYSKSGITRFFWVSLAIVALELTVFSLIWQFPITSGFGAFMWVLVLLILLILAIRTPVILVALVAETDMPLRDLWRKVGAYDRHLFRLFMLNVVVFAGCAIIFMTPVIAIGSNIAETLQGVDLPLLGKFVMICTTIIASYVTVCVPLLSYGFAFNHIFDQKSRHLNLVV
ncbi:MAG: hypothetical protein AAF352_07715, partial [Pseudomonadota bacterium]